MGKLFAVVMIAGSFLLAGCNTVEGFGEDLSKLGDKIDSKAEEKKKY